MRYDSISLTPSLLLFTLAAACAPGSTGETATTGTTGSTGGASSTSTGTSNDPTTTDSSATTSTGPATTTTTGDPATSTTGDPATSTTGDSTGTDTATDGETTTTTGPDPVEENCQGLEFPPDAPADIEDARWIGPMSIRLTSAEKFLCSAISPEEFGTSCTSGFLVNADFPAPIVPGTYIDGQEITMEGVSAVWDGDCGNGGYGGFVPGGTLIIYAVSDTCIAGALVDLEDGIEARFLAPKCP